MLTGKRRKLSHTASGPNKKPKGPVQKTRPQQQERREPSDQDEDSDDDVSDASEDEGSESESVGKEDGHASDQESDSVDQTADDPAAVEEANEKLPETFKELVRLTVAISTCPPVLMMFLGPRESSINYAKHATPLATKNPPQSRRNRFPWPSRTVT